MGKQKIKEISQSEIYDLVAFNVKGSSCTSNRVKEILDSLRRVMIDELKNNGKCRLYGIGTFTLKEHGGYDTKIGNFVPCQSEKVYIPKKDRVMFKVSGGFEDEINGTITDKNAKNRIKRGRPSKHDRMMLGINGQKPELEDLVDYQMMKRISKLKGRNNES